MQTSDIHNLVKKIPLFQGLLPSQIRELLTDGEVQDFKPDQTLCSQALVHGSWLDITEVSFDPVSLVDRYLRRIR